MTYNIFGKTCYYFDKSYSLLNEKPDILLTQENGNLNSYDKYKIINNCYSIATFHHNLYKINSINEIKCMETKPDLEGASERHGNIIELNGIKIANIHLEGGRDVDKSIHMNFYRYLQYKLEILSKIINEKPDIIAGDFNSYYEDSYTTESDSFKRQRQWYKQLTDEQIIHWNKQAYQQLKDNGYVYAEPNNKGQVTSIRGNTIIDTIWYKPNKVKPVNCEIISLVTTKYPHQNIPNDCVSDHFPVFCRFQKM